MYLTVGNKVITTPVEVIIKQLKSELDNGKLREIQPRSGQNIKVTCPIHKDGMERRPSCYIFVDENDKSTQLGQVHCFTCGYTATLPEFISDCFDESDQRKSFGEEWLLNRCETAFMSEVEYLPPIDLDKPVEIKQCMNEDVLKQFEYYHDYMWERKLSKDIVDTFEIGYDVSKNMITFPVRDEKGSLLFITKRSVKTKFFEIPDKVEKPVYLLYYALKHKLKHVAVVESQINALYLWSLGIPAVALFGTGSPTQYEALKRSGIRSFSLFFDGDWAGHKGAKRFIENMPKDTFITTYKLPSGKDVNDLTLEEIKNLSCF